MLEPKRFHQLFLDDGAIHSSERITRRLHQPRKCGPLIPGGVQSRNSPQWNPDKQVWEWWYFGGPLRYATSADGEHWDLPDLGLYEWEGSKRNNLAADPDSDRGERAYHLLRDDDDPDPQRRYKGLLATWGRRPALSPDGFQWTPTGAPAIPSSDESQFTWDPYSRQYLAMVKQGTEWGRSVFLSTGDADFREFSEPKLIFHSDETDHENCRQRVRRIIEDPAYVTPAAVDGEDYIAEIYNMAVFPYQGLYVGFPVLFNPFGANPPPETNFDRINQVELSVSRDLYNWERVADRAVFLGVEPYDGETYDTGQLLMAGQPVVRDDGEIWCYYNGLRWGTSRENYERRGRLDELHRMGVDPRHFDDGGALSLAKLRPDGFVSLEGSDNGVVTTRPFELKGEEVFINADARWGEIYTEILDAESGRPIPGFWVPGEPPPPFTGDSTRARVAWKTSHDLVFDKPVQLKFYLHRASLFSFWIE
ncbi:MAG: hypothetical protein OXH50_08725 [Gemmatimonadetes bacterium]|nr:hypothetical protein [Gemmatimonadota bacterium]